MPSAAKMTETTTPHLARSPGISHTDIDGGETHPVSPDPRDCPGTMGGEPKPIDDPNRLPPIVPISGDIAARFTDRDGTLKNKTTKEQGNVKRTRVETAIAPKRDARGSALLAQWASALLKPEPEECETEGCRKVTNAFTQSTTPRAGTARNRRYVTPLATANKTKKRKLCKGITILEEAIAEDVKTGNEVDGSDS